MDRFLGSTISLQAGRVRLATFSSSFSFPQSQFKKFSPREGPKAPCGLCQALVMARTGPNVFSQGVPDFFLFVIVGEFFL